MRKATGRLLASLMMVGCAAPPLANADEKRIPAFPGAEGAGMFAAGGRGGTVYVVTNLNARGPGSLADAVSKPNRIVVFAVSGIIDLSGGKKGGRIVIDQPHITIAGQTAPGEGICLKGGSLRIDASDVVVRHLRVRRGFNMDSDSGDGVNLKGKADTLENVILDHVSSSWATDENLTCTANINKVTAQYCIASEGLDYENPKQTPPRHSEGSLFGSSVADGRVSFHHLLYAHHRLRCPRTTGGAIQTCVLDFRNSVVYDCSEYTSHTGSEAVRLNWINNVYKAGPSTPPALRDVIFTFRNSSASRMYLAGNQVEGSPAATADNWAGVRYEKGLTKDDHLRVDKEFAVTPVTTQPAAAAYETVLAESGATLPARDAVDLRIVRDVRRGTGKVIDKETDLPAEQRWPVYHSLPAPPDADRDGLPDWWEEQFGLDRNDPADAMRIAAGGYANVEHYINNTHPRGGATPVVHIAATVSRARPDDPGELRVTRSGPTDKPLTVTYTVGGTAAVSLSGTVTISAGASSAVIPVKPAAPEKGGNTVVVTLNAGNKEFAAGCPRSAMVVTAEK